MPIMSIPGMGFSLEESALKWYLKMRVKGMPAGGINSAYRSLAEQETLFFARYTRTHPNSDWDGPFDDVRWYLGERYVRTSSAGPVSVPGTSTHNVGQALDMATNSEAHDWMVRNAPAYGWKRTLWDAYKVEPWHWEWAAHRVTINDTSEDDMDLTDRVPMTPLAQKRGGITDTNVQDALAWARVGGEAATLTELIAGDAKNNSEAAKNSAAAALSEARALRGEVKALREEVARLQIGGVDYAALAAALAPRLAKAVNDDAAKRLAE